MPVIATVSLSVIPFFHFSCVRPRERGENDPIQHIDVAAV
jgi:hypothetical protein